ncbi:MAG TPA: hypothetical protein VKV34_08170, partial [Thermoleophilia bacterium]|nr:hypothetical protein [Thermoleophilia bacterium]
VMALVAGLAVVAVVHHSGTRLPSQQVKLLPAAPSVATGPTDLVVESGSFTPQGAREPVPPSVLAIVDHVPGVGGARGVVRGFTRLVWSSDYLPAVVVSWDQGYFKLTGGRAPAGRDEIAINAQVAQLLGVGLGGQIRSDSTGHNYTVVGTFSLQGIADPARLSLVAASAEDADLLARISGYTRLDVTVKEGQNVETVREAIARQLPADYSVFGVSRLGNVPQLEDELLIQRAYFDLLSPVSSIRAAAVQDGQDNQQNKDLWARYQSLAAEVTLRIQRYTFQDPDHATLVYEIYYGSDPSPIISAPQAGAAVRIGGVWKVALTSTCNLINVIGSQCTPSGGTRPPPPIPPGGWDAPSVAPGAVFAFGTIANPQASLAQKVAVVVDGDSLQSVIAGGLANDAAHAGHVQFSISGVRSAGAGQEDVLYSLTVTDDAGLNSPWPLIGQAVLVGGTWRVTDTYACGLQALAGHNCG